jgi:hypothetical protein
VGNVHEVIQTEPRYSGHGAAIAIVRDSPGGPTPSYVHLTHATRRVGGWSLPGGGPFVCIQTGGKWGYDDDLIAWLRRHATMLEPCCFYVQDEYTQYVREIRLADGDVSDDYVVLQDGHVGLFLVDERPAHRAFGVELLTEAFGASFSPEPPEPAEPGGLNARVTAALLRHALDHWKTWVLHGAELVGAGDARGGVEAFERARDLAPADKRSEIDARIVLASEGIDPAMALALGRASRATWLALRFGEPLERLARLEREHGDPDAAAALWMESIAVTYTGVADRLACLAKLGDADVVTVAALLRAGVSAR